MKALEHAKAVEHWVSGDAGLRGQECRAAAAELRRLHAESEMRRALAQDAMQENKRLAEVNAELVEALKAVCKEFDVFKFPLNEFDMSQAAFASISASNAIAKAKEQQ